MTEYDFIVTAFVNALTIACIVMPIICILLMYIVRKDKQSQRKLWNNGVCKETGLPWLLAYYNSNGSRVYVSDVHTMMFITYSEIDAGHRKTVYTNNGEHEYEELH